METSKNGDRWRFFGKACVRSGEPPMLHGLAAAVRLRRDGHDSGWGRPPERTGP